MMAEIKNEMENLKTELEELKKKTEDYLSGWKRAKADYLNFKKDTEKQHLELLHFANVALIIQLLPIFDHFKLALSHIPEEEKGAEWVKGFFHIQKQFVDFFKNLGIEEIKTIGEKFNPEFHEAVSHEEKPDFAPDVIFEEATRGYTLHGKVLKPAKVKVAK